MTKFTMVEYPTSSASASADFFEAAFGWRSTSYGPMYEDVPIGDGVSLGFQADLSEAPAQPLVVLEVEDLDVMRERIVAAGGLVTVEPFSFPGGSRMHFREPGGNVLAVYVRQERQP
jgi:predicted enzyme related to lactoylglutathione lyase